MPRLVDLTHVLDPEKAERKLSVETIGAETVNKNVVRLEGQWYIMSNIAMVNHIGTHIEVPYHIFPGGHDLATMPLESFCGPALLVDLSDIQRRAEMSAELVRSRAEAAGGIEPGDIVLCNLGYADRYGSKEYGNSPYFSTEAIRWLAGSGMKLMGVDAGGVEIPLSEEHVNHSELFRHNIPLIENVANLDKLKAGRFTLYAFPIAVAGVEAFPVRVVAELPD